MRLLRRKDDGEFELVRFMGKDTPFYAVLSHTWGADEDEVTFKDLVNGTAKTKAGYRKLLFCEKKAASDGLRYFWIDTCCIDKSSSAEESEALISMFRWYQEAARCYVYLSDVSCLQPSGEGEGESAWEQAFTRSRWFRRGWTLQELLAPSSVVFFSADEQRLGDKQSLERAIHDTTGIPIKALHGSSLSWFSISERMRWTTKRETKREEDRAYCLLGIFGIYMPPLYGEGGKNAMNRLQKEIRVTSGQGEMHELVRIGGASWNDLSNLDETKLEKLDSELKMMVDWMLEAGDTETHIQKMSAEAGFKMRSLLNDLGVSYHDESHLKARSWRDPWSRYTAPNETGVYRLGGFLENRWYWANHKEDCFTGVVAVRTLLDLMTWRAERR
ncbi:MAG: hypothetical protein Q9160_007259 [Pyrenula sp. 1 TL-2023]